MSRMWWHPPSWRKRSTCPRSKAELEGAEHNKEMFPGLVYRVKAPGAAFLIFTSSKVVCTGAKNVEDVRMVIHVQNVVASADLKTHLNMNAVALAWA